MHHLTVYYISYYIPKFMKKSPTARLRGKLPALFAFGVAALIILVAFITSPGQRPVQTEVQGIASSPNMKIAFFGDTGTTNSFKSVVTLAKNEGSDAIVTLGDMDYSVPANPTNYESIVNGIIGANFPWFMAVGNHDISEDGDFWRTTCSNGTRGCYANFFSARLQRLGIGSISTANLNSQMYSLDYQGVKMVFIGDDNFQGLGNSTYAPYIENELKNDTHTWKLCIWHRNQNATQVGEKGDSIGWQVFEKCRQYGAIIINAHEHSYHRTKTLSNIQTQTVDAAYPDPNALRVEPGRTFLAVSGLGGSSIRSQIRCTPTAYPYGCKGEWAKIHTSNQGAKYGALFLEFNVDGNPAKARGYFKNINGEVVDQFTITTTGTMAPPAETSVATTPTPTSTPATSTPATTAPSTSRTTSAATTVATTTAATSTAGQATSGRLWSATSPFNQPIPADATYVREDRIGSFKPNEEEWSAPIYRVPQGQTHPTVRVVNRYSGRVENWPIPTYATPTTQADHHMVVMYPANNVIYEFWDAAWSGTTTINAGGMKDYPLNGPGITNNSSQRVIAAGFALTAGMGVREDFTNPDGSLNNTLQIKHALTMSLNSALINTSYVSPAVGGEEAGRGGANGIPMGARYALPRNLNVDALNVHPLTKTLLRAARDYGIFVNDGNGTPQFNGKHVGAFRFERGLAQQLYGQNTDVLDDIVRSEIYNVIAANGIYRVNGGTPTSASTTSVATSRVSSSVASSSRASSTAFSSSSIASSTGSSTVSSTNSSSDGSSSANSSQVASSRASSSRSTTSTSTGPRELPLACRGDYDKSGTIDRADLILFARNYKRTGVSCELDIVGNDCKLDIRDLLSIIRYYKRENACRI